MQRLIGILQQYPWGSTSRLAELRGEGRSADVEAEVWYGAHERGPSTFADGRTLLDAIEADPLGELGGAIVDRFGPQLPFLVKLLAADSPLSIQAHPTSAQALEGFAAEEAAGTDRDARNRNFKDQNPKPELIYAISPFEAMVGFRPSKDTERFFVDIGFDALLDRLRSAGPKAVVEGLLDPQRSGTTPEAVGEIVAELVRCCSVYSNELWAGEAALICRLANEYPGDPGVAVGALLNYVVLEPGQSLFLHAGNMHAYVSGLGLEVMGNSDNVLRGGLTAKHIDVPILLDVVSAETGYPEVLDASSDTIATPAPEFSVRRHSAPDKVEVIGPQIVVAVRSCLSIANDGGETLKLSPTEAAWLSAGERAELSGPGLSFSITTGAVATLLGG